MKQSKLFTRTSRNVSKEEVSVNAQILMKAGFVDKVLAGVYTFLPLGWRVLSKIENIVREEMDAIGGQEIFMPALQPKENWLATGRWDGLDVLFKIKSRHSYEYALGPTHEEIVTPAAATIINSYKDLPLAVYQIQTKFRDELRAKSGVLRTREFRMKDLYSFHATAEDLDHYYEQVAMPAYDKIYKRLGLDALVTEASGGTFSKFSHEYQVEIENGEDVIYVCQKCGLAKNKEIFTEGAECTHCGRTMWRETKASEVGNIFKLQNKYSDSFNLKFVDAAGARQSVLMGCYGIGTSRLMGVLAEKYHDARGLIWPKAVAPYQIHLLFLGKDAKLIKVADRFYEELTDLGLEVLYDDRPDSAGVKLADSDLLGLPMRLIISDKTLAGKQVEMKWRQEEKATLLKLKDATVKVQKLLC